MQEQSLIKIQLKRKNYESVEDKRADYLPEKKESSITSNKQQFQYFIIKQKGNIHLRLYKETGCCFINKRYKDTVANAFRSSEAVFIFLMDIAERMCFAYAKIVSMPQELSKEPMFQN